MCEGAWARALGDAVRHPPLCVFSNSGLFRVAMLCRSPQVRQSFSCSGSVRTVYAAFREALRASSSALSLRFASS